MIVMNNLSYCLNQDFSNDSVMKLTSWKANMVGKVLFVQFYITTTKKIHKF